MFITIVLSLLIIAIILISMRARRSAELRAMLRFDHDLAPQLRISVVVTRARSVSHVASMLRSESTAYQVVVVDDFSAKANLLRQITQYFGLFKASYTPSGELPPMAISSLLRSHRLLFSKIVVVDSPASSLYTPYQVGAAVSSYNYNLQIRSSRRLRPTAIENLLFELSTRSEEAIEEISSAIGEKVRLLSREAALPSGTSPIHRARRKRVRILYRLLQ